MSFSETYRPHVVYRCYDAAGVLLYVGCTQNLKDRMRSHRSPKADNHLPSAALWGLMARYEVEHHPDRLVALAAERHAIATEHPLLNIRCQTEAHA